jgi:hypothetical protein
MEEATKFIDDLQTTCRECEESSTASLSVFKDILSSYRTYDIHNPQWEIIEEMRSAAGGIAGIRLLRYCMQKESVTMRETGEHKRRAIVDLLRTKECFEMATTIVHQIKREHLLISSPIIHRVVMETRNFVETFNAEIDA